MTREKIMEFINRSMVDMEVITLWNECAESKGYYDDRVYDNDETFFNEMFRTTYDAVRAATNGDYNVHDDYVVFDGYANLQSFDWLDDNNSPVDEDILVDWLMENPKKLDELGIEEDDDETEDD